MGIDFFSNLNLSKKLGASFLALAFIPVVIVTFLVEYSAYKENINMVNEHNNYAATFKAESMSITFLSQKDAMLTLAQSVDFQNMNVDSMTESLKHLTKNSSVITNMFVADTTGRQIARDSGNFANVGDRDYFTAIKNGKDYTFSDALISKSTGKVIVIACVPIKNAQGQLVGIMGSTFNMDAIDKILSTGIGQLEDRREIIYLTDSKGNVMLHPNDKYVSTVTNWSAMEPIKNPGQAIEYTNAEDETCLASSTRVPQMDWTISVETPKNDVTDSIYKSIMQVVIICIVMMLLAAAAARVLTQHFVEPLEELKENAMLLANGDLRVNLDTTRTDEIGDVSKAFQHMATQLQDVIRKISVASQQVASGSKNISDSGTMLANGASTQASSVEELSASISEITAQTSKNAENATEANILTETVMNEAKQGDEQMSRMLVAMDEINVSSTNISKIIKTIEEIAFQTNILALNAAVEAARAGQYGKGFAVVAEEVRNLAARSAKAAKETTDIIEASFDKVNHGTELANETAAALKEINADVTKVATLISEIADASNKQSSALQMLNQGVLQVSTVVQTNSATAEESAAASTELNSQAELLQETIARFKV